jgi:hypothetical protein
MDNETIKRIVQKLDDIEKKINSAEPDQEYVILSTNKNLDELDIIEQKSIKSQDSLRIVKKIKKKIASSINVCGIGSTLLSIGSLLV